MTTETSVTVNNNSPIQDYVHPDDQTQPFEMTPGFKPFTKKILCPKLSQAHFRMPKGYKWLRDHRETAKKHAKRLVKEKMEEFLKLGEY